jgi:TusA-related sulfurtransferase
MKIDVRSSTCQGGGALWSLLSHVRELPPGDSIEVLTDDHMAGMDIPAYVRKRRWSVTLQKRRGYARFVIERPKRSLRGTSRRIRFFKLIAPFSAG